MLDKVLSVAEIKSKLEGIESDKSHDPDRLYAYFLKECSASLVYPLHLIFRYSVKHS